MKKYEIYRAERERGMTYREIADKYGVSKQNVAQACGKMRDNWFKPYTSDEVVYPNLLRWLNENRISRSEMLRRMGQAWGVAHQGDLTRWFRGASYPQKRTIDKLIEVTGLSYEELWER